LILIFIKTRVNARLSIVEICAVTDLLTNNPIEIYHGTTAEQPDTDIINYGEGTNPELDGNDVAIDGIANNADPDE